MVRGLDALCNKMLPDKSEATAAIRKERTTAGPAWSLATWPVMTYTPAPNVLPTPVIKHVIQCMSRDFKKLRFN